MELSFNSIVCLQSLIHDFVSLHFNTSHIGTSTLSFLRAVRGRQSKHKQAAIHMHDKPPTLLRANTRVQCIPQASRGRKVRQATRFGSPSQAACRHLILSATSLRVRKDLRLLGGYVGFSSERRRKLPRGRSLQLRNEKGCQSTH